MCAELDLAGGIYPFRKTVGQIEGVKVLQPDRSVGSLKLPEESHRSASYIVLDQTGNFRQMRVYNEKHEAIFEIGYHPKSSLGKGKILHVHEYVVPGAISHKTAKKFRIYPGDSYYEKYKKYFKGFRYERKHISGVYE